MEFRVKKDIEYAITGGMPIRVSRNYRKAVSPLSLEKMGYLSTEYVRTPEGGQINYKNADQYPIVVQWEGSNKNQVYAPGEVVYTQKIKAKRK